MLNKLKKGIAEFIFAVVFSGFGFPTSLTLRGGKTPDTNIITKNKITKSEVIFNKENKEKNNIFENEKENQEIEEKIIKNVQNVTLIAMVLDRMYNLFKPKSPGPSGASARKARIAAKNNLYMQKPIGTNKANLPKNF